MAALLDDIDTKREIVQYLKSQNEKEGHKQKWREVWIQVSDDTRLTKEETHSSLTGALEHRPCCLVLRATWDESAGVGRLEANYAPRDYSLYSFRYEFIRYGASELYNHVFTARHYTDVIKEAQSKWAEAYVLWVENTLPESNE